MQAEKIIFPLLSAGDIDVRVQQVNKGESAVGCILLLYKDARCDMRALDSVVGAAGWQREHYEVKGNLYCKVGILVDNNWVWKSDCGAESYSDKEKGEASDSFKRACVNWGIGRELYSAPFIYVALSKDEYTEKTENGKTRCNLKPSIKFHVSAIEYNDAREISKVEIKDKNGVVRFPARYSKTTPATTQQPSAAPAPTPTIEDPDLEIALDDVKKSTTVEKLKEVWECWKGYHSNNIFITAVNNRKIKLNKPA